MKIDNILKDKRIIICEDSYKKYLLKEMAKKNLLLDIKFYTKKEFFDEYLFKYEDNALSYLVQKYNFKVEVALMYLNNLYYIDNKEYQNPKLNYLKMLKEELELNNLLIYNKEFKNYIENYELIVIGYPYLENNELNILNTLKANIIPEYSSYEPKEVYTFLDMEKEVDGVFKNIAKLISKGVDIKKIKIVNASKDYYILLERYAKFYHIPLKKLHKVSLYSTNIGKTFLENLKTNMADAIKKISNMDEELTSKIINICNKYTSVKDINVLKKLLIYEFKKVYVKNNELKNYLDVLDIEDYFASDDYIFLINFNTSSIPKVIKDEDYLDDNLKKEINLKNSIKKNILYKEYVKTKIKSIKNLWLSYKLKDKKTDYYPSTLISEMNLKVVNYEDDILTSYSLINDKLNYAKSLYNYETYGINNNLDIYANTLGDIYYNSYDNKFNGINNTDLKSYLNNILNLSYSSLNNYHKCHFRYYLDNILKVSIYEDTFEGFIGSLFHDVLEKCLKENIKDDEIDKEIDAYVKNNKEVVTSKEQFFINKIRDDIKFAVQAINEQYQDINLNEAFYEKLIVIDKSQNDMTINFKGFIDKILYKTIDNKTYVAIIDYKTGYVESNLKYVPYGMNMQLPIYLYLVKKSDLFLNPEIIGFYLQFILNNNILRDNAKTLEEIKKENLKLVGYSTNNISSLVLFDKNYENSHLISGLKVKNDGNFYKGAKVLNEEQINKLMRVTENIIDEDISNILKGDFTINPKKIGYDKEVGCEFCHFKDICYKKASDEIILEDNIEDFLEEVNHE